MQKRKQSRNNYYLKYIQITKIQNTNEFLYNI